MNDNTIEYFELDEQRNTLRMQIVALADDLTAFIGCGVLQIKEIEHTLIKIKALHDELDRLEQQITKSLDYRIPPRRERRGLSRRLIMKDVRVKSEQIKPMASYTEEHQPSVINEFIGLIIEVLVVMLVMFFVMLSF